VWHRIEPLTDSRWDALAASHPQASVFHTRTWLEALWQTYGYSPIAYTTSPPGVTLQNAIVFCRVESSLTGQRLVSLPFSDHCDPLASDNEFKSFIASVEGITHEERVRYVEIRPLHPTNCIAQRRPHRTYVFHEIDLRPPLEVLSRNLHHDSIRRKIRRAQREGLIYESGSSETLLDCFWKLFLPTRRRHGAPPPPKQWFRNVLASFGSSADLRVAFHRKQPVAAVITIRCKDTMVYKYGCSDARAHPLGGMPFLLWTSIHAAKEEGLAVFDLGRSDCDATGLINFKDRWGASRSALMYYRFPGISAETSARSSGGGWTERWPRKLFSHLPNPLFSLAGRLLYKHLG
jgi:hypothetical protein